MSVDTISDPHNNQVARHNTLIYATCQALSGSATIVNITLGGLAGSYLLAADKSLATAPVTGFNLGVAIGAIPAAMLTRWLGRKFGFISGLLIGVVGLLISAWALAQHSFLMFCLGVMLTGMANGFSQQYRFAAADHGTPKVRDRAISLVLVGGIVAALIGSPIVIFTRDLALPVHFAGAYLSVSTLLLAAVIVMAFLKKGQPTSSVGTETLLEPRPLAIIIRQPRFIVAVLCGTLTFALMSFVMTGAPLAMAASGISLDHAALGIEWHVLAMFGPSFVTGSLINRFGKETIVATGMALLVICALVALAGMQLWNFWLSLILLGVGWNFGFIGATSMVTDTYAENEKNKAQGANDFILFSTVAFSSLMSGLVFNFYGWNAINYIIFPVVALALVALVWLMRLERR